MARAARKAMSVTYGFRDAEGTETDMLVHMTNPLFGIVDFVGFVEYLTYAKEDLANAAAALSECDLTYIGIKMRETEATQGAFGTGEAEKKGVFLFLDSSGYASFRMAIPGIKESVLAGDGRSIDFTDAAVIAYLAAMHAGTDAHSVTANGFNVGPAVDGYKQHRQSSKGRGRRTG